MTFDDATAAATTAHIPAAPGTYVLRISATDGALTRTADVTITRFDPTPPTVIDTRIASDADDVEQNSSTGSMYVDSSDLEMVADRSINQIVGRRFVNVQVPRAAVVVNAHVQFMVDEASTTDAVSITVRGESSDDAAPFEATAWNLSNRPTTAAAVTWSPGPWPAVGAAGPDQQTPNLAAIVQEVVSRSNWASGNALALMLSGPGLTKRTAESYRGNASGAALLHVEYASGAPDITVTPASHDFGVVPAGSSASASFEIANDGTDDLEVAAPILTGTDASSFAIVAGGGAHTLPPGQSRSVDVRVTPASTDLAVARLQVSSNDPDEPLVEAALQSGQLASVTVSPTASSSSTAGDADDPAIWIHPTDPARSLVFGSDKSEGVYVFDLSGAQLQHLPQGTSLNNIDVRAGFTLGGQAVDILAGNLRDTGKLAVFVINPDYAGSDVLTQIAGQDSVDNDIQTDSYGLTLYRRPSDGTVYVFERPKSGGTLRQYRIEDDGTPASA